MLNCWHYCDYDTCFALKAVGYPLRTKIVKGRNVNSEEIFEKELLQDLVSLYEAQRWFREEKDLIITVLYTTNNYHYWIQRSEDGYVYKIGDNYESYEKALLAGIKETIELVPKEDAKNYWFTKEDIPVTPMDKPTGIFLGDTMTQLDIEKRRDG